MASWRITSLEILLVNTAEIPSPGKRQAQQCSILHLLTWTRFFFLLSQSYTGEKHVSCRFLHPSQNKTSYSVSWDSWTMEFSRVHPSIKPGKEFGVSPVSIPLGLAVLFNSRGFVLEYNIHNLWVIDPHAKLMTPARPLSQLHRFCLYWHILKPSLHHLLPGPVSSLPSVPSVLPPLESILYIAL